MSQFNLVISIVPHEKSDLVMKCALSCGASGGTVITGRGTSPSSILAALGLGDTSKDLVYIIVESSIKDDVMKSISSGLCNQKKHFGIMFSLDVDCMVRTGNVTEGKSCMNEDVKTHELISVILNQGYADDAMAAARKAGAGGGTIIGARGTAREDDERFFGVHIVPQKEMLMILVDTDKRDAVVNAIKDLPCLCEKGSGIAFCTPVDNFTMLGKL